MANKQPSVYDPNTGDLVPSVTKLVPASMTQDFKSINNVDEASMSKQGQISPRQTRTGVTRGEQTIKGCIKIKDDTGKVVVILGYQPGAF